MRNSFLCYYLVSKATILTCSGLITLVWINQAIASPDLQSPEISQKLAQIEPIKQPEIVNQDLETKPDEDSMSQVNNSEHQLLVFTSTKECGANQ